MSAIKFLLISKKQHFVVTALILTLLGSLSTVQASNNVPTSASHVSYAPCSADLIINDKEIDCTVIEGSVVVSPKKYSLQSVTDFRSAHIRFEHIVADVDGPIALIVGLSQSSEIKALFDKNNILTLNMPTNVERQDMIGTGIRKAIKQINSNLAPEQIEKFVKQALERSIGETVTSSFSESGLMQHELCHTWLNSYVNRLAKGHQPLPQTYAAYGTVLPDWLDEAVAVSCENVGDRERRISDLRRTQAVEMIVPLASFLESQHPRNNRQATFKELTTPESQSEVTVSVKISARGSVSPTIAFYAQAYGVLNFLKEISGRPDIAGQIINAFVKGGDARAAVLNSVTQQRRLSLAELEQLWAQWVKSNARPASTR